MSSSFILNRGSPSSGIRAGQRLGMNDFPIPLSPVGHLGDSTEAVSDVLSAWPAEENTERCK
jgi:hypothetical protein